ncbi:hypothetical protein PVL29_026180 [Vitis rotundifolia]|uniref:Uncharacterized protein n=1 Tax=Vitis rotundifolia TaxID=103349 RepID=A0AA39D5M7_VITRO|nr:hypothetical protein PVL29_026180 [Vitis rotundifolia]
MEAKYKKTMQKNERLRQKMEELRAGFYQKLVDDMFFFNYRICMKKYGITQDTPSYPTDDEDVAVGGPAKGDRDAAKVSPSGEQT